MADSSLSNRVGLAWRFPGRAVAAGAWAWLIHLGGVVGQCRKSGGIIVCQGPPDDLAPQGDVRSLVLANEWFTPVREVVRQLYPNITRVECPFRGVKACSGDDLDLACPCFAEFNAQTGMVDDASALPSVCADDSADLLGAEAEYVVLTTLGVVLLAVATRSFGRRIVQWFATCCRRAAVTDGGQGGNADNQGSGEDDGPQGSAAAPSNEQEGDNTREPFGIDWTVVSGLVEARAQLLAYSMIHESRRNEHVGRDDTRHLRADTEPSNACAGTANGAEELSDEEEDAGNYEVMRSSAHQNPFLDENGKPKAVPTLTFAAPSSVNAEREIPFARAPPITSTPLMDLRSKQKMATSGRSRQALQQTLSHVVEMEMESEGADEEEASRQKKERSRLKKLRNSFAGIGKEISQGGRSPSLADLRGLGIDLSQPLDGRLLESLAPVFMKKKLATPKEHDSGVYTEETGGRSRRRNKNVNLSASGADESTENSPGGRTAAADSLEGAPTTRCRLV